MAQRVVPSWIVEAATAHMRERHSIEDFDATQIGAPTSRTANRPITWDRNGPDEAAWFRCRRCDDGFDRYSAELDRAEPTPRILNLIREHLTTHQIELADASALTTPDRLADSAVAIYRPPTVSSNAAITCETCKARGYNPVDLAEPLFGDARRLRRQLRDPMLAKRVAHLSTSDQATYLDAYDRGVLDQPDVGAARAALQRGSSASRPSSAARLDEVLLRLLKANLTETRGITAVIDEFDELARRDPEEFACQLGEHIPELAARKRGLSREAFSQRVALNLGCTAGTFPTARRSRLWRVWTARPESLKPGSPAKAL